MSTTVITKPKVEISESLLSQMKTQVDEVGQVIIHVLFRVPVMLYPTYIRIWQSTYLYDCDSPHKSELAHAENITLYPEWYECMPGTTHFFSLIFTGLPKSCTRFDFIEHCSNEAGAFKVMDIERNETDVYYLRMA